MKAIIVDDEPKSRDVLKFLVERHCPEVEIAGYASGVDEAKKLLSEVNPQLILLDV
jgi:two-component system, LytTR family, response regulator